MNKLFQNQRVIKTLRALRPWITFLAIFLVLRYSGALTGVAGFANTALMKSGMMDIDADATKYEDTFDYNFTIRDQEGKVVDVNQFKGKVIFLNLWATWCGPCVAEMPSIQSLYEKMDKEKIVFIVMDWFEEPGKVSKFIKRKEFTFPVYHVNGDVPAQLNVPSIPTTFIISPQGKIVTKKSGSANYDTEKFKKFLEDLSQQANE
jgi:thiol-disulfide isomerase/thioredoxin